MRTNFLSPNQVATINMHIINGVTIKIRHIANEFFKVYISNRNYIQELMHFYNTYHRDYSNVPPLIEACLPDLINDWKILLNSDFKNKTISCMFISNIIKLHQYTVDNYDDNIIKYLQNIDSLISQLNDENVKGIIIESLLHVDLKLYDRPFMRDTVYF